MKHTHNITISVAAACLIASACGRSSGVDTSGSSELSPEGSPPTVQDGLPGAEALDVRGARLQTDDGLCIEFPPPPDNAEIDHGSIADGLDGIRGWIRLESSSALESVTWSTLDSMAAEPLPVIDVTGVRGELIGESVGPSDAIRTFAVVLDSMRRDLAAGFQVLAPVGGRSANTTTKYLRVSPDGIPEFIAGCDAAAWTSAATEFIESGESTLDDGGIDELVYAGYRTFGDQQTEIDRLQDWIKPAAVPRTTRLGEP